MPAKAQTLITFFQTYGGILRFSAILKAGFHPDSLIALEEEDEAQRTVGELYRLTKYSTASYVSCCSLPSFIPSHRLAQMLPRGRDSDIAVSSAAGPAAGPPPYPSATGYRKTPSSERPLPHR